MFKKSRLNKVVTFVVMCTLFFSSIIPVQIHAENGTGGTETYKGEGFEVTYKVTGQWDGAFNADVTIKNVSKANIENWILSFASEHEIQNIWNAEIVSYKDGVYIIKNAGWNHDIKMGQNISFGFTASRKGKVSLPESYQMLGVRQTVKKDGYEIDYRTTSRWQNGYTAEITIKNLSDMVIEDWELSFDLKNEIETIWNGVVKSHTNESYTIYNADHNAKINVGQSVTIGYKVNVPESEMDEPKNFFLNEVALEEDGDDYLKEWLKELKKDSDNDEVPDFYETNYLNTDPYNPDSDGNGVSDGDEDFDGDGLTNAFEITNNTNPISLDTDIDGLSDYDEIYVYHTDPLSQDTDGDGASDSWELVNDYDPCVYNDSFKASIKDKEENGNLESVSVELMGADGLGAESLNMEKVENALLNEEIPGYIGSCYEFLTDGDFESAKVTFTVNKKLIEKDDFQPTIYYFNEETQLLEEVEGQKIEGNVISAKLFHFSKYILVNKVEYDEVWRYILEYQEDDETFKGLDVAFVIGSSGSMTTYDKNNVRKEVTKQFIDQLTGNDRAAVIDFDSSATLLSPFTYDKDALKTAVDKIDSSGGTSLSVGISMAINQFLSTSYNGEGKLKYIIMLTDGDGTYSTTYTTIAKNNDIVIYTVGLGNAVSTSVLTNMATGTGGKYYHADQAGELYSIFNTIADQADLSKDSDGDGLCDYYEKEMNNGNLRLGTGIRLTGLDYLKADSDGDGLMDGEEIKVMREPNNRIYVLMYSNPTMKDTDEDGYRDNEDPLPLIFNSFKYLGDEEYFKYLDKKIEDSHIRWLGIEAISRTAIEIMIEDYKKYPNPKNIPDTYWDNYCNEFNTNVIHYGSVFKELHYFRNNLNRVPPSLSKMISIIKNASEPTWTLLSVEKSQYHMYGVNGEYNMKFISRDGKYEGVYNILNGIELTEVNDPVNMGTYNYGDPNVVWLHAKYDVVPFYNWGNTESTSDVDLSEDTVKKYNNNKDAGVKRNEKIAEMSNKE